MCTVAHWMPRQDTQISAIVSHFAQRHRTSPEPGTPTTPVRPLPTAVLQWSIGNAWRQLLSAMALS